MLRKQEQKIDRRRGAITVLALMVSLIVMIMITATMTMTVINSDVMADFARNKKSLQAADSGLAHGRITLNAALNRWDNFPAGSQPSDIDSYVADAESLDPTLDRDISLLLDSGNDIGSILPRGSVVNSEYTEQAGNGLDVAYNTTFNVHPDPDNPVTGPPSGDISYKHTFHYNYEITSEGAADIEGQHNQATRVQSGSFDLVVERPGFATYGYFTETTQDALGSQLWFYNGEVYDGPTHVNSQTQPVAFNGSPVFKGKFTAVQGTPGNTYQNSGAILQNASPVFEAGEEWGRSYIPTPQNNWSQSRAAMGDYDGAANPAALTDAEVRNLMNLGGSGPVPQGCYYAPNSNSSLAASPLGGIYINGDAESVKLTVEGSTQVITVQMNISDGGPFNGSQTWVFRDDKANGTLTVTRNGAASGTWSTNLNGVISSTGKVKSLTGSGNNAGDVQKDSTITVAAAGDIVVDDHITYELDPRTDSSAKNVLGLFSASGNVLLGEAAPANLNLHATVMATGTGKGVGARNLVSGGSYNKSYGNKGKWNLLGGLIENTNQTTGVIYSDGTQAGYTWNFDYDDRFLSGTAPPYFPYVTAFSANLENLKDDAFGRKYY